MTLHLLASGPVAAATGILLAAFATAAETTGDSVPLGQGTVQTYAVTGADGAPTELGVIFSGGVFDGLPPQPNRTSRCFDLDGNGAINETGECEGDYQTNLPLPADLSGRDDIPFEFAMVNWNPHGHPPAAWAPPHFDIHFYSIPQTDVQAIRLGSCGIFMDCDDFQRAIKPVPAKYINPDHISVEAAVGAMGNHLIDSKTPELGDPPQPFTHTWIYGAYDGKIIFHEVMVTRDFLTSGQNGCTDIKLPEAFERAGYYPTRYCFRRDGPDALRVYLDGFVMRPAG